VRFAYADPPYYGCGQSHYGEHHPEAATWDDKATHLALVERLVRDYPDGWVLSCNPRDLAWLLPACPDDVRVAAWCKTWHQIRPTTVQFSWEPVVFRGGRKDPKRSPMVRDWMACAVTRQRGLKGAKPDEFNQWVLDLLAFREGDTLDDLFPGTSGMADALASRPFDFEVTEEVAGPEPSDLFGGAA
jgi:hypothetical protein